MKIVIIRKNFFRQKWSFQLVAHNGRILASSEKYYNRVDLVNAIDLIKREIGEAEVVNKYF